jgi:hypothetical protein
MAGPNKHGWWDLFPFPSHRIPIGGGLWTTNEGVDAKIDVRTESLRDAVGGSLRRKTIADLGCLEGAFAVEFARMGAELSIGIEPRQINFDRCEAVRKIVALPNLRFIQADVKDELPKWEQKLDIVFLAGLLYHVSDPYSILKLSHRAARELVYLDTHVAHPRQSSHGCSEVVEQSWEGFRYRGRLYTEYARDISKTEHEGAIWSAWSDHTAFWPIEEDLVRMAQDVGFASVEKIDAKKYSAPWQVEQTNRVLYVLRK